MTCMGKERGMGMGSGKTYAPVYALPRHRQGGGKGFSMRHRERHEVIDKDIHRHGI